ncbi:hypothetical protein C0J52_16564 [Blattella germanica]|nr:hypothetical protein C0J52_16564 [Blattella germanica]
MTVNSKTDKSNRDFGDMKKMAGCLTTLLFFFITTGAVQSVLEEEKQATMLSAKVGEYVVFDCPLDFPHDYEIPYILRWNKEVGQFISPSVPS